MARFLLPLVLATSLLLPASLLPASADARRTHRVYVLPADARLAHRVHPSRTTHRRIPSRRTSLALLASRDPVALAKSVAEHYWGTVPCGGQIAVLAGQPLAPGLDPTTDGWATFESSLGPNDLSAPAGTYTRCTISLAHWQWPARAAMESDWNMLCLTVIHEMGHLLGRQHSLVPGSVMAPVFTDESNVPPICRSSRPAGGETAGQALSH